MANPAPSSTLVFRDGKQSLPGGALLAELIRELHACQFAGGDGLKNLLLSALLRCGELECGIADQLGSEAELASSYKAICAAHDELALAVLDPAHARIRTAQAERLLRNVYPPDRMELGIPEGFCYYGLHPLDYAELVRSHSFGSSDIAVIGIRSIGTTLSAITAAALRKLHLPGSKISVERTTVRPHGHPYERETSFTPEQARWVHRMASRDASFLIVDEGPGLSGSSFISAGEALSKLGVDPQKVFLIGSRSPDPEKLVASNAADRWRRFRSLTVRSGSQRPADAQLPLPGGDWRQFAFRERSYDDSFYSLKNEQNWPACWTFLSHPKFVSEDGGIFFKFEGLGRYGIAVHSRAALCAEAGFSAPPLFSSDGYTAYPIISGRLLSARDLNSALLKRIASYIAFRSSATPAASADTAKLEQMTRHNFQQIFGSDLPAEFKLEVECPVIADGRLHPHEWLATSGDNHYYKLDCAQHGDNHFFPGPCDIAWDLAGAAIEWEMSRKAVEELLDIYFSATGDDPRPRFGNYLLAYAAFQAGYAAMAARSMVGFDSAEESRLARDYHRYRKAMLAALTPRMAEASAA